MKHYLFSSKRAILIAMLLFVCIAGYSQSSTVSSSTVWNSSRVVSDDVIVRRNCTLTINSSIIYFANRVKIIVESGGLLNLNGCSLTSQTSSEKWGGVEVRGLLKVDRSDAKQGIVNATGSTIENAILGIGAGKIVGYDPTCVPDPDIPIFDTETSGGKIIATNCVFKNNNQAVAINSFGNINNGSENSTNSEGNVVYTNKLIIK